MFTYPKLAQEMIEADHERNLLFDGIDKMYHNEWDLPAQIKKLGWVRTRKNSDPRDSARTAIQIFSGPDPRIKITPLADDEDNRKQANLWERYCKTWLTQASRRRRTPLIRDYMRSSILYDMIAAQVEYLPYQERIKAENKASPVSKLARKQGDFVVHVRRPHDVHFNYSDIVPEQALYVSKKKIKDVLGEYGKRAEKALKSYNLDDPEVLYKDIYVFDYTDPVKRAIWCNEAYDSSAEAQFIVLDEDHNLDFFPWVVRCGGTALEDVTKYQLDPLLGPIYNSGDWETLNVVESLSLGDIIFRAAQPRHITTGGGKLDISYDQPGGVINVPIGTTYAQAQVEPLDPKFPAMAMDLKDSMAKSTLPRIMTEGNPIPNAAFATMNLSVQSGVTRLRPYRELAELALADTCELFLDWIKFDKQAVKMYGNQKDDWGKQYIIDPAELPERIEISVELSPDIPTDRQQRVATGTQAVAGLGYSKESALEDIGVTDPLMEMAKSYRERIKDAVLQNKIQEMQMRSQMGIQMEQQEQQMAMQNEMMNNMPQESEYAGMDPNQGGLPAQMANPGMTREGVTGMTQGGEDVAAFA